MREIQKVNIEQIEKTKTCPEKRKIDKESRIFRSLINYISQPPKNANKTKSLEENGQVFIKNKDKVNKSKVKNKLIVDTQENIVEKDKKNKNLDSYDDLSESFYPEALFYYHDPPKNIRSEDLSIDIDWKLDVQKYFIEDNLSFENSDTNSSEIIKNGDTISNISILQTKNNRFLKPSVFSEEFTSDVATNEKRIFAFTDEQKQFLEALDKAKEIHKRNEWESTQADIFEKAANDGQQKFWVVNDWKPVLYDEIDMEALLERNISMDFLPELGTYEDFVEGMNRTKTTETIVEPSDFLLNISMPTYSEFVEQLAKHQPKTLKGLDCSLFLSGNIIPFS